jgi:hypothetical protein
MSENVIFEVVKERATLDDDCMLCDRPFHRNENLWVIEGTYGDVTI